MCLPAWSTGFGGAAGTNDSVYALTLFDGGSGPALYVGGAFTSAGSLPANGVARWDGSDWSALGSGVHGGWVQALAAYQGSQGPALYAAGTFTSAGLVPASSIAKWDGASWSALGSGLSGGSVSALTIFDDGSGPALYAAGTFTSAGGSPAAHIARWDGTSWSALAGSWPLGNPITISALAVCDDGSGSALYVGGILQAFGPPPQFVARWTGSSWTMLTSPADGGESVLALAAGDLGGGPRLYAGGSFLSMGGSAAESIAAWDGSSWSALGSGLNNLGQPPVAALACFDDGTGLALYAAGSFSIAGGVSANNIARWDGAQWSALGAGLDGTANALARWNHGSGPALFAGGSFLHADGAPSDHFGEWALPPGCAQPGGSICEPGTGGIQACPCSNPPTGSGRGCDNSAQTGGAALSSSGVASLAHDTLAFATSGELPHAPSMLIQTKGLVSGGVAFGQGLRCVTGSIKRLYYQRATGGSIALPLPTARGISARSAALGDPIAQGTHRYYGVYYRDPVVLGGCAASSTFNITQQLDVLWFP